MCVSVRMYVCVCECDCVYECVCVCRCMRLCVCVVCVVQHITGYRRVYTLFISLSLSLSGPVTSSQSFQVVHEM